MTATYRYLSKTGRENIEGWLKEKKSQSEIARLLDRDRSTVSHEIKRGTTIQFKETNGYQLKVKEYYAETR